MKISGRRDPADKRTEMVRKQIRGRGISDPRVLRAMLAVARHRFVPPRLVHAAYADRALPLGRQATISQPYVVARMTAELQLDRDGLRVLEVGTGSGYQAAVLAECGCEVFSVERIGALFQSAGRRLSELGYADRVRLRHGDGSLGWPEQAPFDRILITAAAAAVPDVLFRQAGEQGLLVAPVGSPAGQVIRVYRRRGPEWTSRDVEGVRFVPLICDPAE
jgi:protein-L-isoaspartate(D-aspartate) O-methyltransferase